MSSALLTLTSRLPVRAALFGVLGALLPRLAAQTPPATTAAFAVSTPAAENLGLFSGRTDVGEHKRPGTLAYDGARETYTVGAAGTNMWARRDDFVYLWKKTSGDIAYSAEIDFVGASKVPHRKACLVIRQTLSYFLWSSMPDDELLRLAGENWLRANLAAQVQRLRNDRRAGEFVRNFTGQWLQARDIATVQLTAADIYLRDHPNPALEEARATLARLQSKPRESRTPEENEQSAAARDALHSGLMQLKLHNGSLAEDAATSPRCTLNPRRGRRGSTPVFG